MNLLSEFIVNIKGVEKLLKLDNKALYRSQVELGKKGLLDLISGLDTLDMQVIYTLAKHSCVSKDLSVEQLLDSDISLVELAQFLAQQVAVLFTGKKSQPAQENQIL